MIETPSKTVAFHTLGCKLNFSETSSLSRQLETEGFEKKEFEEAADVYVINTCSVTENADKECRQLVRRIQRRSPDSLVVITGCYAQLKPKEIAEIPGVDLVLGAAEKFNLATHLRELTKGDSAKISSCDIEEVDRFHASWSMNDRTRTFLKVQDGCDYSCSFCTIPLARGRSRSDSIQNVVANAMELGRSGVKEIVLTGVNLGDFGLSDIDDSAQVVAGKSVVGQFTDIVIQWFDGRVGPRFRRIQFSAFFIPHISIVVTSSASIVFF